MPDSNITKKALAAALKSLMQTQAFEKISVGEICEVAPGPVVQVGEVAVPAGSPGVFGVDVQVCYVHNNPPNNVNMCQQSL